MINNLFLKQDYESYGSSFHSLVCSLKLETYQNDNFYHFDNEYSNDFSI